MKFSAFGIPDCRRTALPRTFRQMHVLKGLGDLVIIPMIAPGILIRFVFSPLCLKFASLVVSIDSKKV